MTTEEEQRLEASLLMPTQETLYRRRSRFDEIQWPIVPFTTERTPLGVSMLPPSRSSLPLLEL